MSDQVFDVIILGGGAAGLMAARDLARAKRRVLILEARDRAGGRIHTIHDPAWPLPIEHGAEFIHGQPPETMKLLAEGSSPAYDVPDLHWNRERGRLRKDESFWEAVETVFDKIDKNKGRDLSLADFLAKHSWSISRRTARLAEAFVEGFDAADKRQVGVEWIKLANRAEEELGEGLMRVTRGYGSLIQCLESQVIGGGATIQLNHPVSEVRWNRSDVTIVAARNEYRARAALVTLPLGVLQAPVGQPNAVRFIHELTQKRKPLALMRMGPVVKVILQFDRPWWEKQVEPGVSFMHAPEEIFTTWWTTLPIRTSMLTGWSAGRLANRIAHRSRSEVLDQALRDLTRITRISPARCKAMLRDWHLCDWQSDPYAMGAYSYGGVNGAHAADELAKPIDKTLFFAGEATHKGMSGTVSGALASGRRAAREIRRVL